MDEEVTGGDMGGLQAVGVGDADYADWKGMYVGRCAEERDGEVEGANEGFGGLGKEGVEEGGGFERGGGCEEG